MRLAVSPRGKCQNQESKARGGNTKEMRDEFTALDSVSGWVLACRGIEGPPFVADC